MLVVSGLAKRFGRKRVLEGVSFEGAPGELCALVGDNGSGKSTLLSILAGQLEADAGDATLDGTSILGRSAPRSRIGFVPEAANPPGRMTGGQLLALVAALKAAPVPDEAAIAALGLDAILDQPIASLSLGQRRRLCLRAALVGEPALLLLDEPSNGLDIDGVAVLSKTLEDAATAGTIVVLATHDRELVARLGARILELERGSIRDQAASTG